ncbi:unnamed protein product, partial [Prorocentrum cordatum]
AARAALDVCGAAALAASGAQARPALAVAARRAPADLLERMVELGANLEETDAYGWTPLFHAVAHGSEENLAQLLELGASASATDRRGLTALDIAIRAKRRDLSLRPCCGARTWIARRRASTPRWAGRPGRAGGPSWTRSLSAGLTCRRRSGARGA